MPRPKDFTTKYEPKVLSIDPAFAFHGSGCGWSWLNEESEVFGEIRNKPLVHKCGVIKPFCNDSTLDNMIELAKRLKEDWHNEHGFSSNPKVIVIERPIIFPSAHIKTSSITDLNILVGIFVAIFSSSKIIVASTNEWKGNKDKESTKVEILQMLDQHSLNNIERDMRIIPLHQRHNAFDAIGLGIYGLKVIRGEVKEPRLMSRAAKKL